MAMGLAREGDSEPVKVIPALDNGWTTGYGRKFCIL